MRRFAIIIGLFLACAASAMAQGVEGVHPDLGQPWQVGIDYTYVRLNEVPGVVANTNGITGSLVRYTGDWIGADVELSDAFVDTQFFFSGVGGRVRLPFGRSFQPWAHALIGYSRLSPSTYGNNSGFGYKAGGGIDLNPFHSRVTYRASVDMLGTEFFSTHQVSPEISFGVVLTLGR